MTNWVAGHTDRFGAIVTHSGSWALDQKNDTADVAHNWLAWFGRPADHPDWYAENSPHHFADRIRTPMLITHGNRDYRVPVSEALRLWWDLVSRWDGDPVELPHRFLNFTGENHWILSPANSEIWYDTVLGFCAPARPRPAVDPARAALAIARSAASGGALPGAGRARARCAARTRPATVHRGRPRTPRPARGAPAAPARC